ncbi:hypothetical protein ORIO_06770 [Cereibacter azotoformans]|uniref:DUF6634 family protein n=1 Tax=Cereibacter azotoformans TaxID=43057 RepID=UPI00069170B2|nr:DUF6634 family protein [Cereibacter azotoformans]ULB09622.1 hypothetical protein ORIO_06770 [Cereibacter azotoformans]
MDSDDHLLLARRLAAIDAAGPCHSQAVLASPPDLDQWRPVLTLHGVALLWGRVAAAPCPGEARINTSSQIAAATTAGWTRTFSRGCRLCVPFRAAARAIGCGHVVEPGPAENIVLDPSGPFPVADPDLLARMLADRIDSVRRHARRQRGAN